MNTYDLIVLGGGPGGYHAAHLASKAGLNTLLIEKNKLGGVCLNEGCIPSKVLLNSAKHFTYAKHGQAFGITTTDVSYHHQSVVERKNKVVKTLVSGVSHTLKSAKVTVITGEGKLSGKEQNIFKISVGENEYHSRKLIIATGSSTIIPSIEGVKEALEKHTMVTSKEILDLVEVPQNLTVIGGGVIGLEMATYFAQVGSKVRVIEMMPSIGGQLDKDISKTLKNILEKQGIEFYLNAKVTKINEHSIVYLKDNQETILDHDIVLLSVGRKANTDTTNLSALNIQINKNGTIVTDETLKTNVANVYAIGDVNGKYMLAHTAYREAEVAVNNILGIKDHINYDVIPSIIYTSPEVFGIGFTEVSAKEKGFDVIVITLPVSYSGRHLAETDESDGFVKLIINKKKNTLIGAHMISLYASEIAIFLTAMMHLEIDIEEIKKIIYPHPTVGELIKDALFHI
ncbi:MAG: dihydrolipoyl dehydrogenase [Acholeplasmataceae bacterium]|nr:dihydrolipoyl dehydrogenase [Acholeplasmataceae bacterium]